MRRQEEKKWEIYGGSGDGDSMGFSWMAPMLTGGFDLEVLHDARRTSETREWPHESVSWVLAWPRVFWTTLHSRWESPKRHRLAKL